MAFYGLGLNQGIVLHAIGYGVGDSVYHKLYNQAVGMIILTAAGSLPGYWSAIVTIDTVGRKPLQVFGFALLTIVFSIMGFRHGDLGEDAMLALYIIGNFLFNAGPNTTTFVVPGECFPTRYRATGHGVSAAMGKIGAIVAQATSIPLLKNGHVDGCVGNACSPYLDRLLKLFALVMFLGTMASLLIPETKGLTLEELSGESRTSYNAGCNGSISLASPKLKAWNPFHGGQPAGFVYPRAHCSQFGKNRYSDRQDIMASPELAAQNSRQQRARFWRRRRRTRNTSSGSNEIALRHRGVDSTSGDSDGSSTVQGAAQQQEVPTWGAGWGRIDRGEPPSSVPLHDVGMLLKPE